MDVEELLVVVCVNDLLIIVFYVIDQIKILQWMGAEFGCRTNEALQTMWHRWNVWNNGQ